jgi:demethylmenaquinone methyltransferase/2-methoxy-6-polyprenyl-1,4-benzoquinol methylase
MKEKEDGTINSKCRNLPDVKLWTAETLHDPHSLPDKGLRVQRTFDAIAGRYDLVNAIISFGRAGHWRKILADRMAEQFSDPGSILDLCCGTGAMFSPLASRFPQARLIGADFSTAMLFKAAKKKGYHCPGLICSDGMQLPFADNSFDMVSCVFGLRNFESLPKGLNEICRILRQKGMLAVLDFQLPHGGIAASLFRFYFERILPRVASAVSGKRKIGAYDYLPQSVHHWYDIHQVLDLVKTCGLRPVRIQSMCFGSVWAILAEK